MNVEGVFSFWIDQQLHMCAVALSFCPMHHSMILRCIRVTSGHTQNITASWHPVDRSTAFELVSLATAVLSFYREYCDLVSLFVCQHVSQVPHVWVEVDSLNFVKTDTLPSDSLRTHVTLYVLFALSFGLCVPVNNNTNFLPG